MARIFYYDDDPGISYFICRGLRLAGHVVCHAHTCPSDVSEIEEFKSYHIFLLDILDANNNEAGLVLSEKIREFGDSRPIIVTSGVVVDTMDEIIDRVKKIKNVTTLARPHSMEELNYAIIEILGEKLR